MPGLGLGLGATKRTANKHLLDRLFQYRPGMGGYTFTRGSNATSYIDREGVLRRAGRNLFSWSEDYDSGAWTLNGVTAVDHGTGGWELTNDGLTSSRSIHRQIASAAAGKEYVLRLKLRAGTLDSCTITMRDNTAGAFLACNVTIISGPGHEIGTTLKGVGGLSQTEPTVVEVALDAPAPSGHTLHHYFYPGGTGIHSGSIFCYYHQVEYGTTSSPYQKTEATAPLLDVLRDAHYIGDWVENLLLWSEHFGDGTWVKNAVTLTANAPDAPTAPDGTQTMDKVEVTANGASSYVQQTWVGDAASRSFTFSCWLSGTGKIRIKNTHRGVKDNFSSDITLTDTPTRYDLTVTNGTGGTGQIGGIIGASDLTGATVFMWGAQLVEGTEPQEYIPTEASTVSKYFGQRTTLLEGQRTNLLLYSEAFDNAAWTKNAVTVAANAATAPDGTTTADKVVANTSDSFHYIHQNYSFAAGLPYTLVVYAKAAEHTEVALQIPASAFSPAVSCTVNLTTGAVISGTATVKDAGNGWWRISISGTADATASTQVQILLSLSKFIGDGSSGIYVWGVQLEQAPNASSYIPTEGATVTRAADNLSFPYTEPPQEMTVYVKFVENGTRSALKHLVSLGLGGDKLDILGAATPGYRIRYYNATAGSQSTITADPALRDLVEFRGVLMADGSVEGFLSVNGNPEISGGAGAAVGLASAFGSEDFYLGGNDAAGNQGFNPVESVKIAKGVKTLAQMRAA